MTGASGGRRRHAMYLIAIGAALASAIAAALALASAQAAAPRAELTGTVLSGGLPLVGERVTLYRTAARGAGRAV